MRRRGWRRATAAAVVGAGAAIAAGGVGVGFADEVNPTPTTDGMPGAELWNQVLGWLMQWGLWLSLAAIVIGAGGWWVSASTGSYGGASKGKQFVLGGAIGALITGLGPTIVNVLFAAGQGG